MSLGTRLLNLRKSKQLSQEEVAYRLNVTRQTISKWETDQSTPDFDKIVPLCELYEITADELLTGNPKEKLINDEIMSIDELNIANDKKKRAQGISIGILLYFISIVWVMVTIPVFMMNPIISSAIFMLICGVATYVIVYTCIVYKKKKNKSEEKKDKIIKHIDNVLSLITVFIYLIVSIITMAWHITWIIWIVYALILEIIRLFFMLRGNENEK